MASARLPEHHLVLDHRMGADHQHRLARAISSSMARRSRVFWLPVSRAVNAQRLEPADQLAEMLLGRDHGAISAHW